MSRQLDPTMQLALASGVITPFFAAQLTLKSSTQYVWTGVGDLLWNSQMFAGVGSLAKIGTVQEGTDVQAYGTTVTLSGIDPVLLNDSMTDMQPGAPVNLWFGLLANGVIVGAPYLIFSGTMDQPTVSIGGETLTISLALENRMLDLSRASNRRYTSADQRLYYPTDIPGVGNLNMPLKRKLHWATRAYHRFLVDNSKTPFAWGTRDCALFAADAVESITGVDIASEFRGKYTTQLGAMRTIRQITGGTTVADAAAHCANKHGLTEHTHPLVAKRGDLVVIDNGGDLIAGVVHLNGRYVVSVNENGLITLPITNIVRSWSLDAPTTPAKESK
jgi:hypothetical protein